MIKIKLIEKPVNCPYQPRYWAAKAYNVDNRKDDYIVQWCTEPYIAPDYDSDELLEIFDDQDRSRDIDFFEIVNLKEIVKC